MTTELPPNPFTELPPSGNRRVLGYEADIWLPHAQGKRVPMQLTEGELPFQQIAQLLERCKALEGTVADLRKQLAPSDDCPSQPEDRGQADVRHEKRRVKG